MNLQSMNSFNSIISDSFLRSYSLSRIVRINEQNRNKAKVIIMRKMRTFKEQNRRKALQSPFKQRDLNPNSPKSTNIKKLKQQLTQIDNCKLGESRFKKNKALFNQIKEQNDTTTKSPSIPTSGIQRTMNRTLHRRFYSDAFQSPNLTQTQQLKIRPKVNSQQHLKAQLRMNQIKFSKFTKNTKSPYQIQDSEKDQQNEYNSSLLSTLSSFNRLRLMSNAKQSQKIMKHFYKRSLENCSLQELKYLIKMEANRKEETQSQQNTNSIPMKFGNSQILKKSSFKQLNHENSLIKHNEQKKSVWNNEVLRQSCDFHENTQIVKLNQTKSYLNSSNIQKLPKATKYLSKHHMRQESKQNLRHKSSLTEMNSRDSEMEKYLVYCYKNKRFPINDNRLSGIYEKWQEEYVKKKRIQELQTDSNFKPYQLRQLKADSIRLDKGIGDEEIPEVKSGPIIHRSHLPNSCICKSCNFRHSMIMAYRTMVLNSKDS